MAIAMYGPDAMHAVEAEKVMKRLRRLHGLIERYVDGLELDVRCIVRAKAQAQWDGPPVQYLPPPQSSFAELQRLQYLQAQQPASRPSLFGGVFGGIFG